MLRRTFGCRSGGGVWHGRPGGNNYAGWPELAESSSAVKGFMKAGSYDGDRVIFRLLDPKWFLNRMTGLYREGSLASPVFAFFMIQMFYGNVMRLTYYDGSPPRHVDWNAKKDGHLPANFKKTVVKTA